MRRAIILAASLLMGAPGIALADNGLRGAPGSADVYTYSASSGRGHLGLVVLGLTDELKQFFGSGKDGVLVGKVEPSSPAARAGLQVGDVLADVDGKPVDQASDVWPLLAGKKQGDAVPLIVFRGHHPLMLTAKLAADVPAAPPALHGQLGGPGFGAFSIPFGFGDDAAVKQLEQRLDQLEQRMHKLDGA